MKVLVAVKRVVDPYVKIRVKPDQSGVETNHVKMSMNPFDEIAVEAALQLREAGVATSVTLVTIGPDSAQETLRHGLALGADNAILVRTNDTLCSLNIAKILHKITQDESPELVLLGKQSIDGDNNQTPQMLAALLNWPQGTYASKLTVNAGEVEVVREIDGGLETLALKLPAVVSTDLRLNEPRYASLPNIMKAKQKPLQVIELETFGVPLSKHTQVLQVSSPPGRSAGVKVDSVQALVEKLQLEAKVL